MTTVLVVDDAAVDRRHVGDLLARDSRLEARFAVDGADALAKMEESLPDLVVTDLIMPRMGGLELVAAVRARYPLVPVILITSQGSEEIAVQALQEGAASYVPKRLAAQSLLETIESVAAVSSRQRHHSRLMGCMIKNNCTFVLDNDLTLTRPLVMYLQETLEHIGLCGEADRTRIGVALEEALSNALVHGNLAVDSALKEQDDDAYHALVRQRLELAPFCDRRIHLVTRVSTEQATFEIRDEGTGFDPTALPDPTDPANLEKLTGRGVLLMRTFMDEVVYNDAGNTVTMTRRRSGRKAPGGSP